MSGTQAGAQKARATNIKRYGPDFYQIIGARSWDDPFRSRETGFAKLPREKVIELGSKGGKTNKGKKCKKHDIIYLDSEAALQELRKAYPKEIADYTPTGSSPHPFFANYIPTNQERTGASE